MKIIGDMAIKDLTPKSTNIGDRIVKNMRICGSGIYTYARSEAKLLHLDPVPKEYDKLEFINVFRPPEVLNKYKDYFARVPIITGHHVKVDRNNAHDLVVGMVGDSVESEVDKDDGETYLYTTGTIVAGDGVDAYERYGQLSVGYDPIMKWKKGIHNGVEYQAELVGFNDVNHLLICKVARGGSQCMVMDSLDELSPLERFIYQNQNGGERMSVFSKIFGSASKDKVAGDEGRVLVPVYLESIAEGANPKVQVQKIRAIVGDSDTTFSEYLGELEMAGDEKPEVIKKAVDIVVNYYKEKMAGDEKVEGDEKKVIVDKEDKDGKEKKDVKVEKDGKETKDIKVEKDGDKKKVEVTEGDEKKQAGDGCMGKLSGDEIDAIAQKTAAIMLAAQAKNEPKTAGDEQDTEPPATPLAGDTGASGKTSDDFMKEIWG